MDLQGCCEGLRDTQLWHGDGGCGVRLTGLSLPMTGPGGDVTQMLAWDSSVTAVALGTRVPGLVLALVGWIACFCEARVWA